MKFAAILSLVVLSTSVAAAETTVVLSELHLCCGACIRGVEKAAASAEGVQVTVNKAELSATLTAANDAAVQKAIDAIAKAGFHGKSNNDKLKMKDDSGVKAGVKSRLVLGGIHNCCGGCNVAIKKALKSVNGVQGDTAKPKKSELVVEGTFDGLAVIKALNKAGFHVVAAK